MPTKTKATIKAPAKPHSAKKLSEKIKADPEYAKFMRGHIAKMKKGDNKSKAIVKKHFKPTKAEAEAAGLGAGSVQLKDCTNPTTLNLI